VLAQFFWAALFSIVMLSSGSAAGTAETEGAAVVPAGPTDRGSLQQLAMRDDGRDFEEARLEARAPHVFGSIALRIANTARSPRWHEIMAEHGQDYLTAGCGSDPVCASPALRRLKETLGEARRLDERSAAAAINRAVNGVINHKSDRELYGVADYWAGFRATVERGAGDCEDIALVKMWMLNALGIPLDRIHLVLVRSQELRADHAVLIVRFGDDALVLDNLSNDLSEDRVSDEGGTRHYLPLLSFSASGEWIHGFPSHRANRSRGAFAAGS
jgi:predicted transglutaminase-like cysteine proteinase